MWDHVNLAITVLDTPVLLALLDDKTRPVL